MIASSDSVTEWFDLIEARPVDIAIMPLPNGWARLVNKPQSEAEEAAIRASISRGRPFANSTWTRLASTLVAIQVVF